MSLGIIPLVIIFVAAFFVTIPISESDFVKEFVNVGINMTNFMYSTPDLQNMPEAQNAKTNLIFSFEIIKFGIIFIELILFVILLLDAYRRNNWFFE